MIDGMPATGNLQTTLMRLDVFIVQNVEQSASLTAFVRKAAALDVSGLKS
jgi:hypothetical protein